MAILGYNVKDTAVTTGFATSTRMWVSKFTLAAGATMSELHGIFRRPTGPTVTVRLVIYADSAGAPAARLAYTSPLTLATDAGASDQELAETGLSVALTAGDYWIGFKAAAGTSPFGVAYGGTGGTHRLKITGLTDPPNDPFGSFDSSGTNKYCCWAVVSGGAGPSSGRFLSFM